MKRILLALLLLVLLAAGLGYIFFDRIVRGVLQQGASYATGVETSIQDVDAGLLAGRLDLEGFRIANPTGFRDEPFLAIGTAHAAWRTGSLWSDTLEIDELKLDQVEFNLERVAGRTNLGRISDNLARLAPAETGTPPAAGAAGPGRTLVVKRVLIENVKAAVHLSELPAGSNLVQVAVGRVELSDFRTDGTTAENVARLTSAIVNAIATSTINEGRGVLPKDLLESVGANLKALERGARDALKDVRDGIRGLEGLLK